MRRLLEWVSKTDEQGCLLGETTLFKLLVIYTVLTLIAADQPDSHMASLTKGTGLTYDLQ